MKILKHAAVALFVTTIVFVSSTPSIAQTSCGGCGVPEELEKDAEALKTQFSLADRETLQIEQFAHTLCKKHDCGAIDEQGASLLLDRTLEEKRRNADWWFSLSGVLAGAAGVVISLLAYFQGRGRSGAKSKSTT